MNWLSALSDGEPSGSQQLYQQDGQLLWSLKPDAQIASYNHHFRSGKEQQSIRITVNSSGYRGRKISSGDHPQTVRVLCMGDSNFFGYPLDDTHTFPKALENALNRLSTGVRFDVINGGVPGYTVVQGRRMYDKLFAEYHFDWILFSYLNNDAWHQPEHDSTLLRQSGLNNSRTIGYLNQLRFVQWARWLLVPEKSPSEYVPRVSLDEYTNEYHSLIADVRRAGAKTLILDYRAYPQYAEYSSVLKEIARSEQVAYYSVAEQISTVLPEAKEINRYQALADRVERRWGKDLLRERPYLWYFAEFDPEHLNEVGTAWLADQIALQLLAQE